MPESNAGSFMLTVSRPAARIDIVRAFAELPDEAFNFCVSQLMQFGQHAGGFKPESRDGLATLSSAAWEYFNAKEKPEDGRFRRR